VILKGQGRDLDMFGAHCLEMDWDSDLVTMERLWEMATWESNGHVTNDDTWPWNVKVSTPVLVEASLSKKSGDTGFVPKDHQ